MPRKSRGHGSVGMNVPLGLALCVVVCAASCDAGPRCGSGTFDAESATCTCPAASDPDSYCELPRGHFDAQAHRGARTAFPPGNTMPAFVEAIRVGADTLESDMQITSDRAVILNHDPTLSMECVYAGVGPAPSSRTIAELLAAEIALFDCHPDLPGIDAPPRLESVLDLHTRANVGFDLELKDTTMAAVDTAMQALVAYDVACAHCLAGRLSIQSFGADALLHARDVYGGQLEFETSYLTFLGGDDPEVVAALADVYAPLASTVTSDVVRDFHRAGLRIVPWTANDEGVICTLVELGVDGIISDDPALLLRTAARCR